MTQSIFITGGTGYIGQNLVKKLHSLGHNLTLLVRESSDLSPFEGLDNITYKMGDVRNLKNLQEAVQDSIDVIYHLAAYVKIWAEDPAIFDDINITGAENIAKVALEKGKKLIYVSSFMAIGYTPIDDKAALNELYEHNKNFNSDYERTKYFGREKIKEYIEKGLKCVLISPGFVYGPGDFNIYGQMACDIVNESFLGLPGKGEALFCMAYIEDVIDTLVKVKDRDDILGENFILGGTNIPVGDYCDLIAEIAGVKKPRRMPMSLGYVYAKFCELKASIDKKCPEIVWPMLRGMKYNWAYSSEKAINQLGYRITPIEEALQKTVDWYKENLKNSSKKS